MIKYLFTVLVVCISVMGAGEVLAQCVNVNLQVEGTFDNSQSCTALVDDGGCVTGSLSTNPPIDIEIGRTIQIPHPTSNLITYHTGDLLIRNQRGHEIYGIHSSTTTSGGDSAELIMITGATGSFSGISGNLIMDAKYDIDNNSYNSTMKGTLCFNVE